MGWTAKDAMVTIENPPTYASLSSSVAYFYQSQRLGHK